MILIFLAVLAFALGDDEIVTHTVRYAKAPVGDLAFKDPVPEKAGRDYDALAHCIGQRIGNEPQDKVVEGSPDCLMLYIMTKKTKPKNGMPVVVYFDGDYYKFGTSFWNADHIVKNGAVSVNVKSRNGALGYLSFENNVLPGNLGLKDQLLALKWIQDNIDIYGGDPDNVIIMGSGSGGASVHYHTVSPKSQGLFKGAISISGVGNDVWGLAKAGTAKQKAIKLLKILNCPTELDENSLKCLQKQDPYKIAEAEYDFLLWDFEPMTVFQPIVEVKHKKAFMDKNPLDEETKIPWIVHLAPNEGSEKIRLMKSRQKKSGIDFFKANKFECMKTMLYQEENPAVNETISKLLEKYIPEPWNKKKSIEGIGKMFGMINYVLPTKKAVSKHKGPIYSFSFDPNDSMSTKKYDYYSGHYDLARLMEEDRHEAKDEESNKFRTNIAKMIVKFAETLKPEYEGANWEEGKGKYLHITKTGAKMVQINQSSEETFWRSLPLFKD